MASILEFTGVSYHPASTQFSGVVDVDLAVGRGEIALIKAEEGQDNDPLASLAQGLLPPAAGRVRFHGEDWTKMGPSRQSLLRGMTRRVYGHYGWVSNLDIMENICLAELYHTRRPLSEIEDEARALALRFGLDLIPDDRPTHGRSTVLRKLEWARAFLGRPDLIILECPCHGAPKADGPKLVQAVKEAVGRGAAVLWLTDDQDVWDCPDMANARRYRMDGETVKAVPTGRENYS
jgi:ABC-type branched-subunit amino acid transport system ATPase component